MEAANILPLREKEIRKDLDALNFRSFAEKYQIPIDHPDLWDDLKYGVKNGSYPPFKGVNAIREYKEMMRKYLHKLLGHKDPKVKEEILDTLITEFEQERRKLRR